MKRQSVIGFALIGIVLLLFTWYNTKELEKQQKARIAQDSIAMAAALQQEAVMAEARAAMGVDSLDYAQLQSITNNDSQLYRNLLLNIAASDSIPEETYYLENEHIKIGISSKGGQPASVLVKEYFKYDSTALYIMNHSGVLDLEMDAGEYINTSDFNYSLVASNANSLILRLPFEEGSYMDAVYSLTPDSYMLEYSLHFVGMERLIPRSSNSFKVNWTMDVPRLEKGYENEKNYSSLAYRYLNSNDVKEISLRKDGGSENLAGQTDWVAFKQQFFSAILISDEGFSNGEVAIKAYPDRAGDTRLAAAAAALNVEYGEKSADFTKNFKFYFGPNHYPLLKSYDKNFDKLIPLGGWLVGSINKYVIIPVFNWLSKYIASYGIIILLLTLLIKAVISPLTLRSYLSSAKMKVIRPEVEKINAKYPKESDALKKQQATMELYQKCGISVWGGCLPILLQFPILYAMFRFFPSSFELRQQSFLWASDLSTYDSILDFGFRVPLYGDHVSLFALLMGVSMWVYSKMTLVTMDTSTQMPGMKFMQLWFMPIFMVVLCNNFSAGLSYYYMLSNLITIGQNVVIRKWFVNEEKLYAKLKEKANSKEPVKKSRFQQRLEEAQRMQQQQQKNSSRK